MRNFSLRLLLISLLLSMMSFVHASEYQLFVSKHDNALTVEKNGKIIKRYHIASGKGGKGTKRQQGDNKTPLGVYRVTKLKKSDRFHFFIQLDYPNLIDAWYGYKNQTINAKDFKRIAAAYKNREAPPQDTKLGGFIGIHGLGIENEEKLTIHEEINWTEGCIALTNREINDLKQFIELGTKVIIKE